MSDTSPHVCGKCGTSEVKVNISDDGTWCYIVCEACQVTTIHMTKWYNPYTNKLISPKQYEQLKKH